MAQQDVFEAGHTYVILANNGRYLGRVNRGGVDYIEAEKVSIDYPSRFRASILGNGSIALKANDGDQNYLSRVYRGGLNNIEAAKESIDSPSEFQVEVGETGPDNWNRARYVYLKANDGKYWGIVDRGNQPNKIEANYDDKPDATRFIVMEAK